MRTLTTGRIDKGKYHEYWIDGIKVPGITTLLNSGLPKPALIAWSGNVVAEFATDNARELARLSPSQRLKKLKGAPYANSSKAKLKGTAIHSIAERMNHGQEPGTIPAGLEGNINSMRAFLNEWQVKPVFVELPLFNRRYSYGGTADLLATVNGTDELWLFDLKTGSGIYGETAYQLLMYSQPTNFYLGDDGSEIPMPNVARMAAVHLTAEGYSVHEVRQDADREEMLDEFFAIMKVSEAVKNADGYLVEIERITV